jgi:hypothetical protein
MVNDVVVEIGNIDETVQIEKITYAQALRFAFSKINQKNIVSSWKDAVSNRTMPSNFMDFIDVPSYGCLRDQRSVQFRAADLERVQENLWHIGGDRGWYFGNWMWKIRGLLDKVAGGVGLRRGRRSPTDLKAGDALDFWRVILANENKGRLLLFAEMKLPGEAWLDFRIKQDGDKAFLIQTATFRPLGLFGRLYWYILIPFHAIIFPLMARNLIRYRSEKIIVPELSS